MKDDPVIDRIRKVRRRISKKVDHDPKKLVKHYIELERKHPKDFINLDESPREKVTALPV